MIKVFLSVVISILIVLLIGLVVENIMNMPAKSHDTNMGYASSSSNDLEVLQNEAISTIANVTASSGYSVYENPTFGYKIHYPNFLWSEKEEGNSYVRFFPGDDQFVAVNVILPYRSISLDDFVNIVNQQLAQFYPDFESSKVKLDDNNLAYKMVFTYTDPYYGELKHMEVITKIGNYLYGILYIAKPLTYNYYLPIVQQMIDSFEVDKAKANQQQQILAIPPYSPTNIINDNTSVTDGENYPAGPCLQCDLGVWSSNVRSPFSIHPDYGNQPEPFPEDIMRGYMPPS